MIMFPNDTEDCPLIVLVNDANFNQYEREERACQIA